MTSSNGARCLDRHLNSFMDLMGPLCLPAYICERVIFWNATPMLPLLLRARSRGYTWDGDMLHWKHQRGSGVCIRK